MVSLLWFISLYFSPASLADVRHVGNGGGFAEMITLVADGILPSRLSLCVGANNPCSLNEEAVRLGGQLSPRMLELQSVAITFSPRCSDIIETTRGKVEIPSCLLYEKEGEQPAPLSTSELTLMALKARLQQAGLASEKIALMKPLAEGIDREVRTSSVDMAGGLLLVHSMKLKAWWEESSHFLVVETPVAAHDISELLEKELGCEYPAKNIRVSFESAAEVDENVALFEGAVRWDCLQRSYKARIKVKAGLKKDHSLSPNSLVIVFQKEGGV